METCTSHVMLTGAVVEFDWTSSTPEQRKALYRAIKRIAVSRGIKWSAVTAIITTDQKFFADSDEDNCRAGRMGVARCVDYFDWLKTEKSESAAELLIELYGDMAQFPDGLIERTADKWMDQLSDHPSLARVPRSSWLQRIRKLAGRNATKYIATQLQAESNGKSQD